MDYHFKGSNSELNILNLNSPGPRQLFNTKAAGAKGTKIRQFITNGMININYYCGSKVENLTLCNIFL
jgi:hypothetical protein